MATNVQVSSSGPQRLFKQKRNSNLQKNVSQYNEKSKNESTSNSANLPDQMLINSPDLEVEQLKNNESMKQRNIVQQNNIAQQIRNGTAKTSYLNKDGYVKQRAQIKRKKSLKPERNKEKVDDHWSDKHTELSPVAKNGEIKNGKHFVFTSCNRETCRKNVTENALNTEKLTEIINNSIKEAMQSIVKETPNILRVEQDSLLLNEQPLLLSYNGKQPEKKTEKSGDQIKNLAEEDGSMSILHGFHKKNYPFSVNTNNVYKNQKKSHDINFIKNDATTPTTFVDKCNKITCPYLTEKLEAKPNTINKSMKSFKKPLKHFTTDNRRMTGNVNIYICSEASNKKEKQESRELGSVTGTDTNIKASVSTISSNKLITNLLERRRLLQKSSLQCLRRKSETGSESRIEEVPQEENHPNDAATGLYVPPSLNPVSNYETAIINTNHENGIKKLEKSNKDFDYFNNNGEDHSCTVQNYPYANRRSIQHKNYIKNNYPMNVKWSTKNNSIIPNSTIDCNCSCTKTICPCLFRNGSVTSIKRFDKYNVSNNKRKDRLDRKWQESEIQDVCIYCTPRRNNKLEQCSTKKLNKILKKCIKTTKQKEPLFKNFGISQRRNCAEQCSISNSILKEETEENKTNMNEEDLPEKIDSQRKEVDLSSSYNNSEKASIGKLNVKDEVTMPSTKSELEKSSLLLSSINYEEKYNDKPPRKIGSVAHLSKDKDQSQKQYISNSEFISPITASPVISGKSLDAVTTQKVTSALKSVEESVIIEEDKLRLSITAAPVSKIEEITETEEEEKELDDKTEKNLKSKKNQKESFFQRVVKRVRQLIGLSNVTDNINHKKRRGCGSSCGALPRNFVNDEDAEDQFPNEDVKEYHQPVVSSSTDKSKKEKIETTQETILKSQSSKNVIISQDMMKDYEYKVETPKDVFNMNKESASKAKLRHLIAKKKMLQQSNRDKYTIESKQLKINKDTFEIQQDAQDVRSPTKAKASKSSKDTMGWITDRTEGSRTTKESNSGKSKNLESLRTNATKTKESKISKDTIGSITSLTESSRTIKGFNSGKSKNAESLRTSATKAKESKSSKDTMGSITNRIESSRIIKEYNSPKSKNLESLRSLQSFVKISAKDFQVIKDTKTSVTNNKEIETQKSFTNSPRTIISRDPKNLDSLKVSSIFEITKESSSLQVLEDPEKSAVLKNEDYSANHVKSTENNESYSIENDGMYHPYTECFNSCIQSKKAQQVDLVCSCKESEKDFRVCIICCCPEDNCNCNNRNNIKTMICVNPTNSTYCDNPHDRCTCQKPICNCSYYDITKNNYNCNCDKITDTTTCSCNKKNIVSVRNDGNRICVTAWKPANDIEKYFSRTLEDFKELPKEYCCFNNSKPYGSEELPYQRLRVFSKVMTELQEKINESVTCKKCKNIPCCSAINETQTITKELAEDKTKSYSSFDRPRSQSRSPSSCKCVLETCNSLSWKTSPSKVKDRYKPTSCYCRQSRSAQCRSYAKCFYCKCSPCRCIRSRETSRSRSCRCDDSLCRNKEVSLSKMTDTQSQIFKKFPRPCITSRNPCSF